MAVVIQLRRGTAAQWTAANPVLAQGEFASEYDTGKFKVGDGVTAWNSLAYSSGSNGAAGATGPTGPAGTSGTSGTGYALSSTSSVTIANSGTATWTTNISSSQSAYVAGQRIRAISTSSPTSYVEGVIQSFSSSTLTVTLDTAAGSGSYSSWQFAVAGTFGATGPQGSVGPTGPSGSALANSLVADSFLNLGILMPKRTTTSTSTTTTTTTSSSVLSPLWFI